MVGTFAKIPCFEFNADLSEVDSFVMIAGGGHEFLNPAHVDWAATFIHEVFHRYQGARFRGRPATRTWKTTPTPPSTQSWQLWRNGR